jgi:multidrug efflux pump subunit AcrA (membrane-fusion protein)
MCSSQGLASSQPSCSMHPQENFVRRKLLAAVVLLVVGVGATGYVLIAPTPGAAAATQYLTATATTGDVIKEASATGSVSASSTWGLGFGRTAALIASGATSSGASSTGTWTVTALNAALGDRVTKGTVLATADSSDTTLAAQQAQATLDQAKATLADDQAKPTPDDRAAAESALTKAQMSLDDVKRSLKETKASNSLSLTQARTAVSDAEDQLSRDQDDSAASDILRADRRSVRDAKRSLTSTENKNAASLASAKQSVTSAELALEDAHRTHDTAIAPADAATIAADTAAVASAEQTLANAKQALAGTDITAPSDGVITGIDLIAGATAPSGDAIQFQAGPMQVTASFTESDLTALKAGQPAKVTVSAIDADLTGTLSSIDPVASSSGSSSVVSYDATVTIEDAPDTIRAGMSADVSVTTDRQTGAIAVPIAALVGRGGNYVVRTLDSSGAEQLVPVEVGLVTDTQAAVTSGLTEGTTVITGTLSAQQSGTGTGAPTGAFPLGGLGEGGAFPGGNFTPRGGGRP